MNQIRYNVIISVHYDVPQPSGPGYHNSYDTN